MSRGQRFTFLGIAALIAVVAVVVLSGGGDESEGEQTAATATATPSPEETAPQEASPQEETPEPTAEPTPEPPPLIGTGEVDRLEFTEGERIRFRVRSQDADEEIHVHGYDVYRDIPQGEDVIVAFPADITGIFEIEFHNSGAQIAELRVEPG